MRDYIISTSFLINTLYLYIGIKKTMQYLLASDKTNVTELERTKIKTEFIFKTKLIVSCMHPVVGVCANVVTTD